MPTFRHFGALLDLLPYKHAEALDALLPERGVLVDVGGGTGRVSGRLARGRRVIVVDLEALLLKRARAKGLEAVRADARFLPFRANAVDGVLVTDALHHIVDAAATLSEAARVIVPHSGRIVVEEFDPTSLGGRAVIALEKIARFGSRFFAPEELAQIAREAGLHARIVRFSRRDYALVASL